MQTRTLYLIFGAVTAFVSLWLFSPKQQVEPSTLNRSKIEHRAEKKLGDEPSSMDSKQLKKNDVPEASIERKSNLEVEKIVVEKDFYKKLENTDALSKFGQTYKKAFELSFEEGQDRSVSIEFLEELELVASVVVLAKEGSLSPKSFSLNQVVTKDFKDGQDLFENDWVKLDGIKGNLKNIDFMAKGKESKNTVEVYIQKLEGEVK